MASDTLIKNAQALERYINTLPSVAIFNASTEIKDDGFRFFIDLSENGSRLELYYKWHTTKPSSLPKQFFIDCKTLERDFRLLNIFEPGPPKPFLIDKELKSISIFCWFDIGKEGLADEIDAITKKRTTTQVKPWHDIGLVSGITERDANCNIKARQAMLRMSKSLQSGFPRFDKIEIRKELEDLIRAAGFRAVLYQPRDMAQVKE